MEFDRELIVRAQSGDRSAHEAIVNQFSAMVFRLISRFFRTREDVEDIAQDVFLKLFARIGQVRPDENFPGWLARVTVNTCYDELRKTRRRKEAMETYGPEMVGEQTVAPREPDSLGKARRREFRACVDSTWLGPSEIFLRPEFPLLSVQLLSVTHFFYAATGEIR